MAQMNITKDMTAEQRIAVLKRHWKKFNKKIQRNQKVRRTETSFMDKYDSHNINAWTDGSKYLQEHYGDRVADQKADDADWN